MRNTIAWTAVFFFAAAVLCLAGEKDEKEVEKKLKAGDRDSAFLLRVNNAVKAGMEWLIRQQKEDGSFKIGYSNGFPGGPTALALLALLKSGVPGADPVIEKGFAFLRTQPLKKTYTVGITIMALEARWAPQKVRERQRGLTRAVAPGPVKMPPKDLEWMKELTVFLLENMATDRVVPKTGANSAPRNSWSYPKNAQGDHSNTQYGILGLRSAQRCGVPIPRALWEETWVEIVDHFLKKQERDGPKVKRWTLLEDKKYGYVSYRAVTGVPDIARGWAYTAGAVPKTGGGAGGGATTGSMTSVGIAALIIGMEGLGAIRSQKLNSNRQAAIRKGVNDGLAWLAHHFSVETNPGHPAGSLPYYYLYGMERAAV
ncbi:MAG: hypothetical protein ACYTHM_14825, partial [Planctomycetota bacterium]